MTSKDDLLGLVELIGGYMEVSVASLGRSRA
jgi:hypothetical protein